MDGDDTSDGVVLVVGSGQQPYREYLIEGASRRHPLWLVDEHPLSWQWPYVAGGEVVAPVETARPAPDEDGLVAAAEEVARARPVRGVFTYDELLVIATARIADRLGLRGLTPAAADRCRNKHLTRLALTDAGVPQPRFALAHTVDEAAAAAAAIGYPVVVKPRGMGASVGVVRADDAGELRSAFEVAERATHHGPAAYDGGVLVEELVAGPEISVDGAVAGGDYVPFCIAHKVLGFPPCFEEVGHVVDGRDPLLDDRELLAVLAATHRALGVRDAITHTEIRLSDRGPVVIEVNARLGGDLIPYLGKLATGVDPGMVAVDVATGVPPAREGGERRCAGVRFLYPPEDCRVLDVTVPEPGAVAGLVAVHAMAAPGDLVRLPPRGHLGRYAYVVCTADDPSGCRERLDAAASLVGLEYETVDAAALAGRPW